jgi:hypothetical protein
MSSSTRMPEIGSPFDVPDETELVSFFSDLPAESRPEDGAWTYRVTDDNGVTLRLSFNTHTRSVETVVIMNDTEIARTVHEDALRMRIDGDDLYVTFAPGRLETRLHIAVAPGIAVQWASLVIRE